MHIKTEKRQLFKTAFYLKKGRSYLKLLQKHQSNGSLQTRTVSSGVKSKLVKKVLRHKIEDFV